MRLAIDASNIRAGGGVTHLVELLASARPREQGFERVVVWGGRSTLDRIAPRPWLEKVHEPVLDRSLPFRFHWQRFLLGPLARAAYCDLLFVPGGTYLGGFRPFVTMSQNLLPFAVAERRRFPLSWDRLRYVALEKMQTVTLGQAAGVIFLTEAAREMVEARTGSSAGRVSIVPHGVADRFRARPRPQRVISAFSETQPFRWLYVSTINFYKHQPQVVRAVAELRGKALPVALDLVGPAHPPALSQMRQVMHEVDPAGDFISYHGPVPHAQLSDRYHQADGFVFASTCETFGQVLLEAMAAGLPIAASSYPPMPEVLANAASYFDPQDPPTIARALRQLTVCADLRKERAWTAYHRAQSHSWARCARDTLSFLAQAMEDSA